MNEYNDKGEKHGYWELYHTKDVTYWFKGNYINDKENGYWEYYHSNGKPYFKGNFINGQEIGYWEWYCMNGNLTDKEFYL